MKPRASAVSASSEARRSKKRLAVYINKHEQLASEMDWQWEGDFIRLVRRKPRVRVKAGRKVQ